MLASVCFYKQNLATTAKKMPFPVLGKDILECENDSRVYTYGVGTSEIVFKIREAI